MKRIFAILMALILTCGLAACSNENPEQSGSSAPVASMDESIPSEPENPESETSSTTENQSSESQSPGNSGSNILIAYFTMPEDVDDN